VAAASCGGPCRPQHIPPGPPAAASFVHSPPACAPHLSQRGRIAMGHTCGAWRTFHPPWSSARPYSRHAGGSAARKQPTRRSSERRMSCAWHWLRCAGVGATEFPTCHNTHFQTASTWDWKAGLGYGHAHRSTAAGGLPSDQLIRCPFDRRPPSFAVPGSGAVLCCACTPLPCRALRSCATLQPAVPHCVQRLASVCRRGGREPRCV
jgi:hypothetical protein